MNAQQLKEPSLTGKRLLQKQRCHQNVYVVEAVSNLLIGVLLGMLHV